MLTFRSSLHVVAASALMVALPCAAQLRLDIVPEASLLASQVTSTEIPVLRASGARSFLGTSATASGWLGSAVQLEAPRATSTGQYTRPKFHVGLPSDSMRSFMNSAGIPADKCQLPMLRARTKSNGDGDIQGTLWLYARCTFH